MINYFWHFKPDEKKSIPPDCININKKYIENFKIITPDKVIPLLIAFDKLPDLWEKIPNKYWVVKADIARLLYIYHYGGIYLDIDCVLMKNFLQSESSTKNDLFLFIEHIVDVKTLGPRECKNPENSVRIANYAFYSKTVKNKFLEICLKECIKRLEYLIKLNLETWNPSDILWVCGPDVITTIYHKYKDYNINIKLLDQSYINHLSYGSWRPHQPRRC